MKRTLVGVSLLVGILVASPQAADPAGVRASLVPIAQRKAPPAFRLNDATGHSISLSGFRKKVVLLNFWATDCGGCKVEIPWFMEFERAHKASGFEVVGVSMDIPYEDLKDAKEAWSRVTPFVRLHQLNYPIVMGDDAVTKAYRIAALPMTYLLDRNGRIAAQYLGAGRQGRHPAQHQRLARGTLRVIPALGRAGVPPQILPLDLVPQSRAFSPQDLNDR